MKKRKMEKSIVAELRKLLNVDEDDSLLQSFIDKVNSTNRIIEEEDLITRKKPKVTKRKAARRKPAKRTIKIKSTTGSRSRSPRGLARIADRSMESLEAKEQARRLKRLAWLKKRRAEIDAGKSKIVENSLPGIEAIELNPNMPSWQKRKLRADALSRLTHAGKSMSEVAEESVKNLSRQAINE